MISPRRLRPACALAPLMSYRSSRMHRWNRSTRRFTSRATLAEVWTGTQIMTRVKSEAAKAAGLPVEKSCRLQSSAWRRLRRPEARARYGRCRGLQGGPQQVDGPVKVIWTREEDIQHDIYRPVYRDNISATLSDGRIVGWKYKVSGSAVIARWLPPAFQNGIDIDAVDSAVDMRLRHPELPRRIRPEPNHRRSRPDSGAASARTTTCSLLKVSWTNSLARRARIRSNFADRC